jgi:alpha-L-arabinofuranosidase
MKVLMKMMLMSLTVTGLMLCLTGCKGGDKEAAADGTPVSQDQNRDTDQVNQDTGEANRNTGEATPAPVGTEPAVIPEGDYTHTLAIHGTQRYDISDSLFGLFFEDINFAVDGGIYAEKIKNRSFEYGSMAVDREKHGWTGLGGIVFEVLDGTPDQSFLNANNPKYARVTNNSKSLAGIGNEGFLDGISIEENAVYDFSGFFKAPEGYNGRIAIRLQDGEGNIYGEAFIEGIKKEWRKYEASLTASAAVSRDLKLYVLIEDGTVDMDMISLFPKDTYKGRKNGLRKELAEALEELSPKFIRFPGGCVVEGKTLESAYSWKDSIGNGLAFTINGEVTYGDVAARPLGINLWGNLEAAGKNPYYMTYGLGFYEYFLLCEDLGAEPVPILNAGLSCLIQGTGRTGTPAQSWDIGTPEFEQYVQDALDLVEFCKGGADTAWGAVRIAMGHEEPFELTYIGIGNEQWGNVYFHRYEAFKEAFDRAAGENPGLYGDIRLIVANGPVAGDHYAWDKIKLYGADYAGLVDEHYYMAPSWFLTNTHRYDTYDRAGTKVFLGEYAAKANNMEAALAEAAYMTGLERNGDIVELASYAPLFGNGVASQWTPDMIWFNNHAVWKSVNYYVQKLFSVNTGSQVLASSLTGEAAANTVLSGRIGVGTWMTEAVFDNIRVISNETGEVLFSEDFSSEALTNLEEIEGSWSLENGQLKQSRTGNPLNSITGDAAFLGDSAWTDYTLTLTATKLSGSEGFLIPFAVRDADNYYHWNIGGWSNTVSCLEQIASGTKSGQIAETVRNLQVETERPYELKIVVKDNSIQCYLDGEKLIDYTVLEAEAVYQVCSMDANGDLIIKLVNVSGQEQAILVQADGISYAGSGAALSVLAADSPTASNSLVNPEKVTVRESTLEVSNAFIYTAPGYSVSVIRIPVTKQ